ncbi:MAG TPA: MotA/TolQ/ExbB proton channel family protein [SAR86 cluster bacterium]|nr:MotA/TolQ/ExbB proton channel family protein [SAR86 cluster bacterium]|tara:strand:+ start:1289 stop:1912 length:624 start_codon:yes stop_codon:yes gene_type:complete
MLIEKKKNHLLLKASLMLSVVIFSAYLIIDLGILSLIVDSDRSKISLVILSIYILASAHWFYISLNLDKEISSLDDTNNRTLIKSFIDNAIKENSSNQKNNLELLQDELSNRHALGHLVGDILLKLGLTGTVIGFILMLLPIGEIRDFDPQILQKLLATMSGGMAVALYTTLTGLVTSMLLKFQYFLLDSDLSHTVNYLSSKFVDEK